MLAADVMILSAPSVTENKGVIMLVASSVPAPTPTLTDTLAEAVTSVAASDHVGDGGGT